ncbi:hypothetical protein EVAR_81889_1 [Eumeta japonica]|uniref:Uncharacterized protein n=1 Tax=Eumeta variegata TaxID=151549 RepID=A0A4C1UWX7_EUMVA|nr:hypothetical protein EVAR_81889_1 [Eumeta japonica]
MIAATRFAHSPDAVNYYSRERFSPGSCSGVRLNNFLEDLDFNKGDEGGLQNNVPAEGQHYNEIRASAKRLSDAPSRKDVTVQVGLQELFKPLHNLSTDSLGYKLKIISVFACGLYSQIRDPSVSIDGTPSGVASISDAVQSSALSFCARGAVLVMRYADEAPGTGDVVRAPVTTVIIGSPIREQRPVS